MLSICFLSNANTTNHLSLSVDGFVENKGQITQIDGQPSSYVSHLLKKGNTNIYLLREGGVAYQFNRIHYPKGYNNNELMEDPKNHGDNFEKMQEMQKNIQLETYRMDMYLIDDNPNAEIINDGESNDYSNYYNQDALFVHNYKKIIFKNIYPEIDWLIYTTKKGGMKYDFFVHPGADPTVIKMKFINHNELYIDKEGNLIHGNIMGNFIEKNPISFQGKKKITTQFILKGDILSFAIENYNPSYPLTIDPARVWATYYGGSDDDDDYGYSCVTDNSGNVYFSGYTESTNNIASSGHQNTIGLYTDAFLVKFNSNGVRQWGTYYGGSGYDNGFSCATDEIGNIYLTGYTASSNNIAWNGYQNTISGVADGFLVKFNSNGVRQWGTYYGGSGNDYGVSFIPDDSGHVYLAGYTESINNIAYNGSSSKNSH